MNRKPAPILSALFLCSFLTLSQAAAAFSQEPCKAPTVVLNNTQPNIFNEEQEMLLGDVMAEYVQKNFRVIDDEEANRYIRSIGARLIAHLPPTNIKFQFYVVDRPELNAFASAGGRIYITRKMIAFVRTEDELAGIIGHELGHGIVRHASIDMTRDFKELLGIDKVGDRKDIFEKFNRMIDNQRTKRLKGRRGHEDDQQLEADRIGFYAMAAAGYDPKAIVSAWDRLAQTEGRTGGGLAGIFGGTKPEERRLRELINALDAIPKECLEKRAAVPAGEFEKWRSTIVTRSTFDKVEKLPGLEAKRSLAVPLRGDITHFQFSPDGKFVIAQDASGINVLKKEPFSVLFRIDATDAKPAKFSPDSKHIVFSTYGQRVEKWDIESKRPVFAGEVYVRGRCWQSELSNNGNVLACYTAQANLELIDVPTSTTIYKKQEFYLPTYAEVVSWSRQLNELNAREIDALQMEFSPNAKYFLAGKVARNWKFVGSFESGLSMMASRDAKILAFDLAERVEVKLEGELKNVVSMPFAFYSDDKIIGQHKSNPDNSGVFSFPSGQRVEKFLLSGNSFTRPYQGNYIFVRPTTANPVGVFDLEGKKFIANNKTAAMDGHGDHFVSESKDGVVGLFKYDRATSRMDEVAYANLPRSNFSSPATVAVSPDLKWLVLSERSRGAVWDLGIGEMKVYIRGFAGSFFDADGSIYADFPRIESEMRSIGMINLSKNIAGRLEMPPVGGSKQFGKYMVRYLTKRQEEFENKIAEDVAKRLEKKDKDAKSGEGQPNDAPAPSDLRLPLVFAGAYDLRRFTQNDGTVEVYDVRNRNKLWSRYYPDEPPTYQFDSAGETAVLYWRLTTRTATEEIKKDAAMQSRLKTLGQKEGDYLVQVVNAENGNLIGQTLIETGEGSFSIERLFAKGDWLTVIDSENRVLMYSIKDGELKWRFFGENAAVNVSEGIAVVENVPGKLSVFSLENGEKLNELSFAGDVTFASFSPDGKKLFALSADQKYYIFGAASLKLRN